MSAAPAIVEDTESAGFNVLHKRHIRVTFECVDARLAEAEGALLSAGSSSPFNRYADDSTPVQRKVVHDYIVRVREAMRRILGDLDIPLAPPVCGARWAASNAVLFAGIDVDEMSSSNLLGYGPLFGGAEKSIHDIGLELKNILGKLKSCLAAESGGDLQARLAKLEQTGDEVRLLRELERVVATHGLVEFRGALAILIDRLEGTTFEIGVFGRVSSGKSSLLDYLLETTALPVGVTPVTAIPTRVSYGEVSRARVEFAQSAPRVIELSALPEYATEQENPGNEKHVARIEVKLPTARLREGIVFVDTPGLGSLAVAGAEETIAYLPRCDLGVVLVDASAGLTTDDLQVVQALYRAGATAMVLVSKADLFKPEERERMLAYVGKKLREQVHIEPPIHAVSVVGINAVLCDRWWEEAMKPQMEKHRELAMAARRRKIGGLRDLIIDALKLRLRAEGPSLNGKAVAGGSDSELRSAERAIDRELHVSWELCHTIQECTRETVAVLAAKLAHAWADSQTADVAALVSESFGAVLAAPVSAFPHRYEELRRQLARALQQATGNSAESALAELPVASGLPVLDVSGIAGKMVIERPRILSLFGEGLLTHRLCGEIEKQFGAELRAFLFQHGRRLREWMNREVQELKTAFDAAADIQRAKFAPVDESGATDRSAMEADLTRLQNWPSRDDSRAPEVPRTDHGAGLPATGEAASLPTTATSPTKANES